MGAEYREYVGKYKMFANLAIRTKIMVGFGILLALIAIGAATSSNNFLVTESQITKYRAMAKETDTLSFGRKLLAPYPHSGEGFFDQPRG